eukprot:6064842-Pyramimonas_sp.AAC.1
MADRRAYAKVLLISVVDTVKETTSWLRLAFFVVDNQTCDRTYDQHVRMQYSQNQQHTRSVTRKRRSRDRLPLNTS